MDIGFSYHLAALSPDLAAINENWRENFYMDENKDMPPGNDVLRVPGTAPLWPLLRQQLIWRVRHAMDAEGVARQILADTVAIREAIEAHLAR